MDDQSPAATLTPEQMRRLAPALARDGDYTAEDIRTLVERGECQAWPSHGSIAVTEIRQHPRNRALNIWLAAGRVQDFLEIEPQVRAWGRRQGCTKLTLTGRKGWSRVLDKHDWQLHSITLTRPL